MGRDADNLEMGHRCVRVTGGYGTSRALLWLDIRRPDHFRPFFLVVGHQSSQVLRRTWQRFTAKVGQPSFYFGIGKRRIDFLVERVDDLDRRVLGRKKSKP